MRLQPADSVHLALLLKFLYNCEDSSNLVLFSIPSEVHLIEFGKTFLKIFICHKV